MNSVSRMRLCLPACLLVRACVWGRSTCSVVCVEERAELATLYVLAEVTAQAQWIPLRERMRGSPFWAPRNRCERGNNFNQRYTHSVSTPTLGLDVRNGRFVQSPEVGLRSHCRAFPVPFIGCRECLARLIFMESHSSCLTGLCDVCESRPRRCHCVNRLCLCVCGGGEKNRVSVARTLLDAQAVTAASHSVTRLESLRTFLCMRFIQASDKRTLSGCSSASVGWWTCCRCGYMVCVKTSRGFPGSILHLLFTTGMMTWRMKQCRGGGAGKAQTALLPAAIYTSLPITIPTTPTWVCCFFFCFFSAALQLCQCATV